ncbi:MAG TPA: type II secretion system minor pseudopilin GspK [Ramlibacter sp.]|uniref:type II secretion system minor pseudopilin GspK n=1 Tax=Ramlibacter sp. TaxID=1917967 RepID=UPI002C1C5F40|nr:type II secretion system minor pseudopilin GspK [Ramlibacter sp.]HVZ44272.1 type II secretion system minor pseudopilin GspK [Ramlibacter sp.]
MKARERGAALLVAMLTVALVATFAAASLWQQWRGVEVESAERARVQSSWILTGALDWARLILREDARSGGPDHLGEPWAVPLQEARLSTFLAADKSATADTEADNTFLSGQVIDEQSLLNVSNIARSGSIHDPSLAMFVRLFDLLGLPQAELNRMAENLRFASDISTDNRSASQAALMPQKVEQLAWLGLSLSTVAALQPFVTILPEAATRVNLNTAPAEVIYAALPGISLADAQRLVAERDRTPFRVPGDAAQFVSNPDALSSDSVGTTSRFFEVRGRLRLGESMMEERSLVRRDGIEVRTVWRERGVVDPTALSRAAMNGR